MVNINKRLTFYRKFNDFIKSNSDKEFKFEILEYKAILLEDIAHFSRFENVESSYGFHQTYVLHNEFFATEKKLLDVLYEISVTEDDRNRKHFIHEMDNIFIELLGNFSKLSINSESAISRINEDQEQSDNDDTNIDNEVKTLTRIFNWNFIFATFSLLTWITIFVIALQFGTFKR